MASESAVENERLSWELEQLRGMVNMREVSRLRADIDGLREEILHMANRMEGLEVTSNADGIGSSTSTCPYIYR